MIRFWRWWIAIGGLVAFLFASRFGISWFGNRNVEKMLDEIRGHGEPVELSEIANLHPRPTVDVAKLILDADSLIAGLMDDEDERKNPFDRLAFVGVGAQEADEPHPPKPWKQLHLAERFLREQAAGIRTLHLAMEAGGQARFPIEYQLGFNANLDHIFPDRRGTQVMALEAMAAGYRNDSKTLVLSLLHGIRLQQTLESEPLFISQMTRTGLVDYSISILESWLNSPALTDADLCRLDAELKMIDLPKGLPLALLGERALGLDELRSGRNFPPSGSSHNALERRYWSMVKPAAIRFYLETVEAQLTASRKPPMQALNEIVEIGKQIATRDQSVPDRMVCILCSKTPILAEAVCHGDARVRTARIAVAVRRFQLQNRRLPKTLEDLTPTYLATMPTDPFNDLPMRYIVDGSGFRIYSVGVNRKDDSGVREIKDENGAITVQQADVVFEPSIATLPK